MVEEDFFEDMNCREGGRRLKFFRCLTGLLKFFSNVLPVPCGAVASAVAAAAAAARICLMLYFSVKTLLD